MANPIKAIKGGITQVKTSAKAVQLNNKNVKAGTAVTAIGKAPATKKTMGPINVAKAFVVGAKDPKAAKTRAAQFKAITKKK
jgi:hypothetical protein